MKSEEVRELGGKVSRIAPLAAFGALALACAVAYWPILFGLYKAWMEDSNNSHGIFVPVISAYLVWTQRNKLIRLTAEVSNTGLSLLLASLACYVIGYAGGIEVLPRLTIVTTLLSLIYFNLGLQYTKALWFPVCFLFFMVPLPVSIVSLVAFPLKIMATKISAWAIGALGIPVFREGNMLYFNNTSLEVAEACSGLRSLYAYIMLGALFAYLANGPMKRKSILVISTIPLALFMNILRITLTGILAYLYGARIAKGFLHEFSGILIFLAGFCVMAGLYGVLARSSQSQIACESK